MQQDNVHTYTHRYQTICTIGYLHSLLFYQEDTRSRCYSYTFIMYKDGNKEIHSKQGNNAGKMHNSLYRSIYSEASTPQ